MKYMVMECHLSYAVVLDEEGRFLKVANRHYEVGQTVTDVVEMQMPEPAAEKKKNRWVRPLAAVAACMVLTAASLFRMGQTTYASVYMTINPEVRIDVNRSDRVVGLDGINTDGDDLIAGYDYKKKELDLVMDELVDRAIRMGYLHEGGQISLVLDADSDEWVVSHSDTLTARLSEHLEEKLTVTIEVTDKREQNSQVMIPVVPEGSDYGESDYGWSDYDESDYGEEPDTSDDSDYGVSDDSDSGYDDGQTDYGEAGEGPSDYEDDEDDDNEDDEDEEGAAAAQNGAQSDYEDEPEEREDVSDYDSGDDRSDYGETGDRDDDQDNEEEEWEDSDDDGSDYGADDD